MMRKCHLNTCPVGIATQDPELRKRFTGEPEHVMKTLCCFVAEEVTRVHGQAGLWYDAGYDRAIKPVEHATRRSIIIRRVDWISRAFLHQPEGPAGSRDLQLPATRPRSRPMHLTTISSARPKCIAYDAGTAVVIDNVRVRNVNRTFGAMLSGEVARRYGHKGLADDTIRILARGTGGQSFGAFLAHGISIDLIGDANDYAGKGLSGGWLIIRPPEGLPRLWRRKILLSAIQCSTVRSAGNATFSGIAGERFAVRNSGVTGGGRGSR